MRFILCFIIMLFSFSVKAEVIRKIEPSDTNSEHNSNIELKRRVFELEKAVSQLQDIVIKLESSPGNSGRGTAAYIQKENVTVSMADTWVCRIEGFSTVYSATGGSRAVAAEKASEKCRVNDKNSGFFCKEAKCEQ